MTISNDGLLSGLQLIASVGSTPEALQREAHELVAEFPQQNPYDLAVAVIAVLIERGICDGNNIIKTAPVAEESLSYGLVAVALKGQTGKFWLNTRPTGYALI